jgi:hypothetical protein
MLHLHFYSLQGPKQTFLCQIKSIYCDLSAVHMKSLKFSSLAALLWESALAESNWYRAAFVGVELQRY